MSEDELEVLPTEFIKKFGSFMIKVDNHARETHTDFNKSFTWYDEVKHMNRILTNEEI